MKRRSESELAPMVSEGAVATFCATELLHGRGDLLDSTALRLSATSLNGPGKPKGGICQTLVLTGATRQIGSDLSLKRCMTSLISQVSPGSTLWWTSPTTRPGTWVENRVTAPMQGTIEVVTHLIRSVHRAMSRNIPLSHW